MTLSHSQLLEAVAEARALIKEHSTPFLNYNKMVSDDQILEALQRVLGAVTEIPKP
jgi:hypothetical protein